MTRTITTVIELIFVEAFLRSCGNTIRGMDQDTANTVNATQSVGKRIDRAARS